MIHQPEALGRRKVPRPFNHTRGFLSSPPFPINPRIGIPTCSRRAGSFTGYSFERLFFWEMTHDAFFTMRRCIANPLGGSINPAAIRLRNPAKLRSSTETF